MNSLQFVYQPQFSYFTLISVEVIIRKVSSIHSKTRNVEIVTDIFIIV